MADVVKPLESQYAYVAAKLDEDVQQATRADSLGGADITPREADWIEKDACAAVAYSQLLVEDRKARLQLPQATAICRDLVARAYARAGARVVAPDDRSPERDIGDLLKAVRAAPEALYFGNAHAAEQAIVSALIAEAARPSETAAALLAKTDTLVAALRTHRGEPIGDSIGAEWIKDITRAQDKLRAAVAAK